MAVLGEDGRGEESLFVRIEVRSFCWSGTTVVLCATVSTVDLYGVAWLLRGGHCSVGSSAYDMQVLHRSADIFSMLHMNGKYPQGHMCNPHNWARIESSAMKL